MVSVRPTVVLTGNGRPDLIPAEYLRRSVVIDTTTLVADMAYVHRAAEQFLATLPRLDLDSLPPPADRVPAEVAEVILRTARVGLSEEGWRACDERSLLHLTLGIATLRGDDDLLADGLVVVGDYLTRARTVGQTAEPVPAGVPDAPARRRPASRRNGSAPNGNGRGRR